MNAWMPAEPPFDPDSFSGVGRLFPLPQVVSFPHVVTPLHVFEERYLSLTSEALDGDGLITMAVLQPGWEPDYPGRPPLFPVGCLGKIISHHAAEDGRYNLLLLGLRRVRLLEELEPPRAFRRSAVEVIEEVEPKNGAEELRRRMIHLLKSRLGPGGASEELSEALTESASLGAVADLAAHSLSLAGELKLRLLEEANAVTRSKLILAAVGKLGEESGPEYPPPFSMN